MPDPCGLETGNRRTRITVTTDIPTFDGVAANLVGGDFDWFGNSSVEAYGINFVADFTGLTMEWEFDEAVTVDSFRLYQSGAFNAGTWQWQSWNGSTWDNAGAPFSITLADETFPITGAGTSTKHRMLGVSGSSSDFQYWIETEFTVTECIPTVALVAHFTDESTFTVEPVWSVHFVDETSLAAVLTATPQPLDLVAEFEDDSQFYVRESNEPVVLVQTVVIISGR